MAVSKVLVLVALVSFVVVSAQARQTLTEGQNELHAEDGRLSEHWQRRLAEVSSETAGVLPTLTSSFGDGIDDADDVGRDLLTTKRRYRKPVRRVVRKPVKRFVRKPVRKVVRKPRRG